MLTGSTAQGGPYGCLVCMCVGQWVMVHTGKLTSPCMQTCTGAHLATCPHTADCAHTPCPLLPPGPSPMRAKAGFLLPHPS